MMAALRQAVADREADLRQAREAVAKAAVGTAFQVHEARIAGAEQIDEPVREYVQRVASFIDGV